MARVSISSAFVQRLKTPSDWEGEAGSIPVCAFRNKNVAGDMSVLVASKLKLEKGVKHKFAAKTQIYLKKTTDFLCLKCIYKVI